MIKTTGITELERRLLEIGGGKLPVKVQAATLDAATRYQTALKTALASGSRTGRIYGNHQASAPGEYPKSDTGQLSASIHLRKVITGYEIYSNNLYAWPLEFGTSKMLPRPMWVPIFKEQEKDIKNLIENAVNEALKK